MAKILDCAATITPQDDEQAIIAQLGEALLTEQQPHLMGSDGRPIALPFSVKQALQQIPGYLAQGAHVQVSAIPDELTPQQAADFLHVSRQEILKLSADGELRSKKRGSRQRIPFKVAVAYQQRQAERTRLLIDEIAQLSQESGNYH